MSQDVHHRFTGGGGVGFRPQQRFYFVLSIGGPSLPRGRRNLNFSITSISLQRLQESSGTGKEVGLLGKAYQDGD